MTCQLENLGSIVSSYSGLWGMAKNILALIFAPHAAISLLVWLSLSAGAAFVSTKAAQCADFEVCISIFSDILSLGLMYLYILYPFATAYCLSQLDKPALQIRHMFLAFCAIGGLFAHTFLTIRELYGDPTVGIDFANGIALWVLGFLAPLYVIWSASRSLVLIESGMKAAMFDRVIAFLLFIISIPIGIFFLNPRIRDAIRGQ